MLSIKPQNTFRTNNDSIIYLKLPNSRNKRIYGQLGGTLNTQILTKNSQYIGMCMETSISDQSLKDCRKWLSFPI